MIYYRLRGHEPVSYTHLMEIRTKDQLERVNKRLKGIKGIIDIERVSG